VVVVAIVTAGYVLAVALGARVPLAVRILAVCLAVVVVVAVVEALAFGLGVGVIVFTIAAMTVHHPATLADASVTEAVGVLAVLLAVAVIVTVIKALTPRLLSVGCAFAVCLVAASTVRIFAIGLAVAVVVFVVEARAAPLVCGGLCALGGEEQAECEQDCELHHGQT